jgi:nucleotide-binding universal stress UspA family protein
MFKHMLVATDGSELSERAVAYAISIAAPVNAQVTALYVVQPMHAIVPAPLSETIREDFAARIEDQAKAAMAFVEETARKAGVAVNLVTVRREQPHKAIVETAHRSRCDLIVMPLTGIGRCRGSCWAARRRRCWPKAIFRSSSIARGRRPKHEAAHRATVAARPQVDALRIGEGW